MRSSFAKSNDLS